GGRRWTHGGDDHRREHVGLPGGDLQWRRGAGGERRHAQQAERTDPDRGLKPHEQLLNASFACYILSQSDRLSAIP
ncbi:MAG: hypothetical protein L0H37_08130, partial [Nitrosospira sp.]|nr:hypothetical protein [Nitrosospira sp.]